MQIFRGSCICGDVTMVGTLCRYHSVVISSCLSVKANESELWTRMRDLKFGMSRNYLCKFHYFSLAKEGLHTKRPEWSLFHMLPNSSSLYDDGDVLSVSFIWHVVQSSRSGLVEYYHSQTIQYACRKDGIGGGCWVAELGWLHMAGCMYVETFL